MSSRRLPPQCPDLPLLAQVIAAAAGGSARFHEIPDVPAQRQPPAAFRALYWWACDLRQRGDILTRVTFDPATMTATVAARTSTHQVITVVRHPESAHLGGDIPALIAEFVWGLGSRRQLRDLRPTIGLLHELGLIDPRRRVKPVSAPIPGYVTQPHRAFCVLYWWAQALVELGWRLHACGDTIARHGFIAEVPRRGGDTDLVIYPGDMPSDGTAAAALANHLARLARLSPRHQSLARQVIADASANRGRAI